MDRGKLKVLLGLISVTTDPEQVILLGEEKIVRLTTVWSAAPASWAVNRSIREVIRQLK